MADGRTPLLIQEGSAASRRGWLQDPNSQSLIPGWGAAEAMMSVNRKCGACPGFESRFPGV
jgi:hypothetical protein